MESMATTRRGFVAGAVLVGATALIGGAATGAGRARAEEAPGVAEGAGASSLYYGQGDGLKGPVEGAIQIGADGSIEGAWVLSKEDSPFISDVAAERLCRAVVDEQGLAVDTVTGATFTSLGVLGAFRDALEQAGVDTAPYDAAPVHETSQGEDVSCDVLVIGAGTAGLCAALAAKTDGAMSPNADSGKSVVLIEQLAYVGGCLRVSDSMLTAFAGSRYNEACGSDFTTDELVDYTKTLGKDDVFVEGLMRNVVDNIPAATQALLDRGLAMPVSDARPSTYPGHFGAVWFLRDPVTGEQSMKPDKDGRAYYVNAGGPYLSQSLLSAVRDAGVDLRCDTKATGLEVEGGAVVGVQVTDSLNHAAYTIRPSKVVFASGCVGASHDAVERYAPEMAEAVHFGCAGTTAEAQGWIEDAGGVIVPGVNHTVLGPDGKLGHYGLKSYIYNTAPAVIVNEDGARFMAESPRKQGTTVPQVLAQPDNKAFVLLTKTTADEYRQTVDYLKSRGVAWEAETLDGLAAAAGIDEAGLASTMAAYEELAASGQDDPDFGVAAADLAPLGKDAPYCAVLMRACYNLLDTSVKVDADQRPVDADGQPVFSNAVCAGSIMIANYAYMCGGFSHITAMSSGVRAGNMARGE